MKNDHIEFAKQMNMAIRQMKELSNGFKHKALDEIAEKWGKEVTDRARESLSGEMVDVKTGNLLKSQGYLTRTGKSNLDSDDSSKLEKPSEFGQVTVGNVAEYADLIHNGHGEFKIVPKKAKALRFYIYNNPPVMKVKTKSGNWRANKYLDIQNQGEEVFAQEVTIPASPPRPFLTKAINQANKNLIPEANKIVDKYVKKLRKIK